jgi:4-aminobutyrate aminotransferase
MRVPDIKVRRRTRAKALLERDRAVVSPSYPRSAPFVMARGEGCVVEDVDGNVYLDCCAGIAVASTGHSHPDVVRAVTEQAARFLHISTDYYHESQIVLGEELSRIAPVKGPARTFFSNSGTEAVEAAIKLARHHTGTLQPHRVLRVVSRAHARIAFAHVEPHRAAARVRSDVARRVSRAVRQSVSASDWKRARIGRNVACDALAYIEHQILAHLVAPTRSPPSSSSRFRARWIRRAAGGNSSWAVEDCRKTRHAAHRRRSAVGLRTHGKDVRHRALRRAARHHRCAKGIASGLPMGVTIAGQDVMDWPTGAHSNTFGGNPVASAAALATIKLVEGGLMQNAVEIGRYLQDRLRELAKRHSLIGDVRGHGLMIGVELVRDRQTKERATTERDEVVMAAFRRGLLVLAAGANTIRFSPPLVLTRDEADIAVRILSDALFRSLQFLIS